MTVESGGLGLRKATGSHRNSPRDSREAPKLTRFRVRARRPKAGPFYGRACSRDRQLPGRQAALLFAWPAVEERRSSSSSFSSSPSSSSSSRPRDASRSAVAPSPEDRLGARLPRGNAPFIHVSLIHRHAHDAGAPLAIYDPYPRDGAAHKYTSCARTLVLLAASFLFLSSLLFPPALLPSEKARLSQNRRTSVHLCEDAKLRIDFR